MEITITDTGDGADGTGRYEARTSGGELVGFAEYDRGGGRIVFPHTVVAPEHQRQGVATRLAQVSLAQARQADLTPVPACSFYARYLAAHPLAP